MNFRRAVWIALGLLLLTGLTARTSAAVPAPDRLARVHWLGLKSVGTDPNAAQVMKVWALPATKALVALALDSCSRWPGHGATNTASALLRPLLDDLITSEFYLEVETPTNPQLSTAAPSSLPSLSGFRSQVSDFSLALRLPAARARLWQTNLPAALSSVKISSAGDWTLVSLGPDTNILTSDFAARLAAFFPSPLRGEGGQRPGEVSPSSSPTTSANWLEADLAPARLANFFSLSTRPTGGEGRGEVGIPSSIFHLPSSFTHLHLSLAGDAGAVLTRATLDFSRPLALALPSWEIPTNLISQPLSGFTAVRGLASWLAALPAWQKLSLTPAPDQAFFWTKTGVPFESYFAAPLPAGYQLSQLAGQLAPKVNPWLATNAEGYVQWATNPPGLVWKDALLLSPCLKPVTFQQHDYVLGGLVPLAGAVNPPPAEFLRPLFANPDLMYYQVEQTGIQIESGLFISQLVRLIFHQAQLPSAATVWLKAAEPSLGDSTTIVTRTGPGQLVFLRKSTLGFTALELDVLTDWLTSPQFPHGLHTFLAPPKK